MKKNLNLYILLISLFFVFGLYSYSSAYYQTLITAAGPGGGPHIRMFDRWGNFMGSFFAYGKDFHGGVNIATGDVDGDGYQDIVTGPRYGGGPQIRVFNNKGRAKVIELWPFYHESHTGVDVAVGYVDGDSVNEIAVSQTNEQAWIKVYRYNYQKYIIGEWKAFSDDISGASIAMGDIDLDGRDEVIAGANSGYGGKVKIFEPNGLFANIEFQSFENDYQGGVDVAAGDYNNDGRDEISVCKKNGRGLCKIFYWDGNIKSIHQWEAYGINETGARAYFSDIDEDGLDDVITSTNIGASNVRSYKSNLNLLMNFFAYDLNFRGGCDIASISNVVREKVVVKRVEDGDTIELEDDRFVRYIGIDAPEIKYDNGGKYEYYSEEATEANKEYLKNKEVVLEYDVDYKDGIGRTLAYVFADEEMINLKLVKEGFASYATYLPNTRYQNLFIAATKEAQSKKIGLWK